MWNYVFCVIFTAYCALITYLKFNNGVCESTKNLKGKTVVITGANTGIGYEIALNIAKRAARVIIACRDKAKASIAVEKLRSNSKNEQIYFRIVDISDQTSIRKFVDELSTSDHQIDILINNAGCIEKPSKLTPDGLDVNFATNYLGHFLLTNLMLDQLKKSPSARIVNKSSFVHAWGNINFDTLDFTKLTEPVKTYYNSNLAMVMFTRELARKLDGTGITVNCCHPGAVRTAIYQKLSIGWRVILTVVSFLFFKTPEEGAQTFLHLALDDDLSSTSGRYFVDCVPKAAHVNACNNVDCKKLWDVSEKVTGLI